MAAETALVRSGRAAKASDGAHQVLHSFALRHGREIVLPLVVVLMIAVFSLLSDVFLTVPNFRNVGVAAAALAAVSFGQTFAILTAGLDLSIGAAVALVSVTSALAMRRYGIPAGIGTHPNSTTASAYGSAHILPSLRRIASFPRRICAMPQYLGRYSFGFPPDHALFAFGNSCRL